MERDNVMRVNEGERWRGKRKRYTKRRRQKCIRAVDVCILCAIADTHTHT
jgi:hypothetical protein